MTRIGHIDSSSSSAAAASSARTAPQLKDTFTGQSELFQGPRLEQYRQPLEKSREIQHLEGHLTSLGIAKDTAVAALKDHESVLEVNSRPLLDAQKEKQRIESRLQLLNRVDSMPYDEWESHLDVCKKKLEDNN